MAASIRVPTLVAAALFDPAVPPPGQFAVHNALPDDLRTLHVLSAGHFDHPGAEEEAAGLARADREFFAHL
ncbi:hypothetical protein GCM10010295_10590 [Streptomyces intermedius]